MKFKKNSIEILQRINEILEKFAINNGNLPFYKIIPNQDDEYVGAIKFDSFMAYFTFAENYMFGYSFMETPFHDENVTFGRDVALLTRFKFDFSEIEFSPYDIHNVINSHEFVTLDFHEIRNLEDAENNMLVILNFINKNLVAIRNIAKDVNMQNKLLDNYFSDQKVIDKKFDKEEFYEDIKLSMTAYDLSLYLHCDLQEGIDRFLCAGNYSPLIKKAIKLEKKGKITVFEKRYTDYLVENGYPMPDGKAKQKRLDVKKKSGWNVIVLAIPFALSFVCSVVFLTIIEEWATEYFFVNKNFIATIGEDVSFFLFIIGLVLLFARLLLFIPTLREKSQFGSLFADDKKWILKFISVIAIVLTVISPIILALNIKNNSFHMENNQLYYNNETIEKSRVEFIYIQGYYDVDDAGNEFFVNGPNASSYYVVLDEDYDNYSYCWGLFDDNGYENRALVKSLEQAGYTFIAYKTDSDFFDSY